jgi:uncharacterized protein (UPF0276 family)
MAASAPLLLDLHNLYANAVNFGGDPASAAIEALSRLSVDHVGTVHIAGAPKSPVKIACAGGRSARLETLLAPIYLDEPLRASLLASPEKFAHSHDLNAEEAAALASIDRTGLAMAVQSFARKRQLQRG